MAIIQNLRVGCAALVVASFVAVSLAVVSPTVQGYPYEDKIFNALDVDKTHECADANHTCTDDNGAFTKIPAKEKEACWLCSVASVWSKAVGETQAEAQARYSALLEAFGDKVPAATGQEIVDWLNPRLFLDDLPFRAWWYPVSAYGNWTTNDEPARDLFEAMINVALESEGVILSVIRKTEAGFGPHTTVLDGWVGLTEEDAIGQIIGVVDSNADWKDPATGALLDYTTLDKTIAKDTFPTSEGTFTGWLPALRYPSSGFSPAPFIDYLNGFIALVHLPEAPGVLLMAVGLAGLLLVRGTGRDIHLPPGVSTVGRHSRPERCMTIVAGPAPTRSPLRLRANWRATRARSPAALQRR